MAPSSPSLNKGQLALNFFVSVRAFLFFGASELVGRAGRAIANIVCLVAMCLIGAIFLGISAPSTAQSLLIGDRLLFYTDGSIEAINAGGEAFGYERPCNLLQLSECETAEETASMILSSVNDWSPSQSDDLTIIVCDYKRLRDDERRSPSQSL